jgi:8-oxo-dGTP diphosphatase
MQDIKVGVTSRAIVLNDAGQMLIVRRSATDPFFAGMWDLPGGRVEANETVEAAAIRETKEEVGIDLRAPKLLFATSDMRQEVAKTWLFYVEYLTGDVPITLSHEHDEYRWIAPQDLADYSDYLILVRLHQYLMANQLLIV